MKLTEILERLRQPVPPELISYKVIKGKRIDFISWVILADLLDERAGIDGWSWKLVDQQQVGNRLTQVWELTILGEDRSISRQASGDEDVDLEAYGTPATNTLSAMSEALRLEVRSRQKPLEEGQAARFKPDASSYSQNSPTTNQR